MPTISTYVDVDVDFDDFDDSEIVEELESRGYNVSKESTEMQAFDKYEIEYLLDLVDKNEKRDYNYYRVRDKLNNLF
jgi:hypothetical protein